MSKKSSKMENLNCLSAAQQNNITGGSRSNSGTTNEVVLVIKTTGENGRAVYSCANCSGSGCSSPCSGNVVAFDV